VTALGSLRQRITTLEERTTKQAQTIAELQDINARGISTVVDQAAQITALRAEVKRSGTIDGADALPLIAAALQWRKDAVVRCGALEEPERDLDVLVTIGDVVWHRYELPLVKAIDEYMASKATTAEIAALTGAT
jgi:uncharacterized coiled-coil protein SlyX